MEKPKEKERTGPKPDTIRLEGDWESSVDKALKKPKPKKGWPKKKD